MGKVGADGAGAYYRCPRRKAGKIPIPVLEMRVGLIMDSKTNRPERLSDWSFRAAVAAGLRRGGILNKSKPTLVLTKEDLLGFAAKTKKRGKSEGRP